MFKKLSKVFIVLCVLSVSIVVLIAFYFSDNIKGYYKFKNLCKTEGGFTVYEKLEPNVGWETDSKSEALVFVGYENVEFVRFSDNPDSEKKFDLINIAQGNDRSLFSSKKLIDLDQTKTPIYKVSYKNYRLSEKQLVSESLFEVKDIKSNKIIVQHKGFGYSVFNRNKSFLNAPSGRTCHKFNTNKVKNIFR